MVKTIFRYFIRLVSVAALLAVLINCVGFVQQYLCVPNNFDENRVIQFHKEPENTVDVLFIGSSSVYSAFSSAHAYDKYGFTSYPYALAGASCVMWKPALQDILRTQKPKLVVLDVFGGGYDHDLLGTRNAPLYMISTHTPLSLSKVLTAFEINEKTQQTSTLSLIFPFFKYHRNMIYDLRKIPETVEHKNKVLDFGPSPIKGLETLTEATEKGKIVESSFTSDTMEIDPETEEVIRDFLEYCKRKDIDVLLVKFPTVLTKAREEKHNVNLRANRVLEIGEEYGFTSLNMQPLFYEIGLDKDADYYNHDHPNIRGQKKVTEYLGGYIQNEMGIGPSELNPDVKAEWDESVVYFDALSDLAEECIEKGESRTLGDNPELAAELKQRINK